MTYTLGPGEGARAWGAGREWRGFQRSEGRESLTLFEGGTVRRNGQVLRFTHGVYLDFIRLNAADRFDYRISTRECGKLDLPLICNNSLKWAGLTAGQGVEFRTRQWQLERTIHIWLAVGVRKKCSAAVRRHRTEQRVVVNFPASLPPSLPPSLSVCLSVCLSLPVCL